MNFSSAAWPPSAGLLLQSWRDKSALIGWGKFVVSGALLAMILSRFLPSYYFQTLDQWIGRPGDALLALAMLVLSGFVFDAFFRRGLTVQKKPSLGPVFAPSSAILDDHLLLDQEIDNKLGEVIGDTEDSALAIIKNIRKLYDTANVVVNYLDNSSVHGSDIGKEIHQSVTHLLDLGTFIEQLPEKMERDLLNVQLVRKEIKELYSLVDAVRSMSMQSHLLAINAAIEASRAGASGAAFRAVAVEMRVLASNSNEVAKQINAGLSRARHVVEDSMALSIEKSSQHIGQVSDAAISIQKLQDNFEDMGQYYKTRFAVVSKQNHDLSRDIADALGQIQYQDVVRQCIDRIRGAIGQRNNFFQEAFAMNNPSVDEGVQLSQRMKGILDDYVTEEQKHKHSARHSDEDTTEMKIEFF
ncbi:methyl-accepting chemotaxis protein [Herbaspirillum sp. RTI4]|uniref:methyl-accepting chemotaxis protein n=1 Tax=Herbaspirillum sp. RTI4 TaxID=3048640 RepID=UPI002AB47D6B|nr:methyl-accepting chemotaxis protein [Herbaspirillum sp. RTI4]MDY7579162.1 methyl-accepting chemotaxis protein [Herbaspirillum sp. RTI4]MEA9981259.1 methyl-accepting chemotaxis protein [Herbaspirillum sp. RTI4]